MSDIDDEDLGEGEDGSVREDPDDDLGFLKGMGYERPTVSLIRLSSSMKEMRDTRQAELEAERQADPGLSLPAPADNVKRLLKHHFGSITIGWREAVDKRGVHKVCKADFVKVLQELGFGGSKTEAWTELASNRPSVTLADLDPGAARVLASFYDAYTEEMGPMHNMMAQSDSLRMSQAQFDAHCKLLSMRAPRGMKRKFPLDLKAIFKNLQTGHGNVTAADCAWLEDYCTRGQGTSQPSSPSKKADGPLEKIGWRNYVELSKAAQQRQAVHDFRVLLQHKFGSVGKAWRKHLDLEAKGEVGQDDFLQACEGLKFKKGQQVWDELVDEEGEVIKLEYLEPKGEQALKVFKAKSIERYGSLTTAFRHVGQRPTPSVSKQELFVHCQEIRMEANPRTLVDFLDRHGHGKVLLSDIDSDAAFAAFGQRACDDALEAYNALETQPSPQRAGVRQIAKEQSAQTKRAPEDVPSERQALVRELERRFQSPVRGWGFVLDLKGKGKLKKDEFLVGCATAGFKGSQSRLWEELELKATSSVRLRDIAPEAMEECKLFKTCCGSQLGRMITAMEAAVPGRDKKKGVKVTPEAFGEICKKVGYSKDPGRLMQHLDAKGEGFLNSKILRFFHEEKKEEKAISALVTKHKKEKEKVWRDKLAAIRMAPVQEVRAVQDKLIQDVRDRKAALKETSKTKEDLLRIMKARYHSIAKCWRQGLNPDNLGGLTPDQWIEGLVRIDVLSENSEDAEIDKYAQLFDELVTEGKLLRYEHLDSGIAEAIDLMRLACHRRYGGAQNPLLQAFEDYDPDGTGEITVNDFRHLMHSIQLTPMQPRLLAYLDANKTGKVRLDWIDKDLAKEAKHLAEARRYKQDQQEAAQRGGNEERAPKKNEAEQRADKRDAAAGQRMLAAFKKHLIKEHGTLVRAWRDVLNPEGNSRISQDEFEEMFNENGFEGDIEMIWKAIDMKGGTTLSLDLLDPSLGGDLRELRQRMVERYGSIANAFDKTDVDGSYQLDKQKFLELCYECQYRGNERRLFAFLDREDEEMISLSAIDRKALREVKEKRAEEERRRNPPPASDSEEDSEEDSQKSDSPKSRRTTGLGGSTKPMPPPEPARDTTRAFREHLQRICKGNALRAWRALDPEWRGALTKQEFSKSVRAVGFAGSSAVIWNALCGEEKKLISMREVDPEAFRQFVSLRRGCEKRMKGLESLFDEKGELTKRLEKKDFLKICRKAHCAKPHERLFEQLDSKQVGGIVWEDLCWLEEHWSWEGVTEQPIRQEPRTKVPNQGLMGRTFGTGPLATSMRPKKVSLFKSNSLPALPRPLRNEWNDRHQVLEHGGNRDMNTLHQVIKIETQEQFKIAQRVAHLMREVPTMQWLQENMPDDYGSDDDND